MTNARRAFCSILFTAIAFTGVGCGGGSSNNPSAAEPKRGIGPHGGVAVSVKDGLYAEIVNEKTPGRQGAAQECVLAVYFYAGDMKSPGTAPSEVAMSVSTPERPDATSVALTANPGSKKDAAPRFASQPGSFDFDELSGELTATVDGAPVVVKWSFTPQ